MCKSYKNVGKVLYVKLQTKNNISDSVDSRKYREIVGSLLYIMTCTRPDFSYAVGKLLHLSKPCQQHWVAAKHILKYLGGTFQYNLCYKKSEKLRILAYSDADCAFDQGDRSSTTGLFLSKQR